MPLTAAHLRELADRLEAEEEQARKELEEAETATEREQARKELEEAKAELAELREQIKQARADGDGKKPKAPAPAKPDDEDDEERKPKMRKGRKRGQFYEDANGVGYVWQGEDEDDLVPVDEEEEAA